VSTKTNPYRCPLTPTERVEAVCQLSHVDTHSEQELNKKQINGKT